MDWQVPAKAVVDRDWDVAIAGCGPAGAVAAMELARHGMRVVAIERHAFPRDKICGDALIPDACRVLDRLGLFERVRAQSYAATRVQWISPGGVEVPLAMDALVARRHAFDALLAEAAVERGAVLANGIVSAVETNGEVATLHLRGGGAVRARVLVLATGADVRLLASLGMVRRPLATSVAIRCYVRSRARIDDLVIAFHRLVPRGYAWIFPLGDGEYNVGCGWNDLARGGTNLREALDAFLTSFPLARELCAGEITRRPIAGATLRAGLMGADMRHSSNVIAIGETIGATFPFTGEGIGKAMETGELAAAVIAHGDLAAYDAEVDALRHRYDGYFAAERWLVRPWLNDLLARAVRRRPSILRRLEGMLDESVDPREVFSLRGLLRLL